MNSNSVINKGETPAVTKIQQLLSIAESARRAKSFLRIVGRSGAGKSTAAIEVAKQMGFDPDRISLVNFAEASPSEVRGQLMPDASKRESWYTKPLELPLRAEVGDDPYVLILDEWNSWHPSLHILFHGLVAPKNNPTAAPRVGPHELPLNLFVIMTGNRKEDGASTHTDKAPILGRSRSVEWLPTIESWLEHEGRAAGSSPITAFLNYAAKAGSDAADFFCPSPPKPFRGDPYPQPRQWSSLVHDAAFPTDPDEQHLEISSAVGRTAADACCAFMSLAREVLPALAAIIAGTENLPSRDPQRCYAIAHCAIRQLVNLAGDDAGAAVASGALDPIVERVLVQLDPELRAWAFSAALASGVPLDQHPRQQQLQSL